LRDALRFLHGVGQGYALAEVIGEKYGPGGVLVWRGIRGGAREEATHGATQLSSGWTTRRGDGALSTYDKTVDAADIKTGRASSESAWGDGTPSPWPTTGTPTPKTIPSSSGASTRSGCGTQEETTTASTGRSRPLVRVDRCSRKMAERE